MKRFNVAVCLSGQPRTWRGALPSILHHFQPTDRCQFTFFGHAWAENSWKTLYSNQQKDYLFERLGAEALEAELKTNLQLAALLVQPQAENTVNGRYLTWGPMLKSAMICNFLKTRHEIVNDVTFDLVVKTRWDSLYEPNSKFEDGLPLRLHPNALYCETSADFTREFRLPAIDDISYFGSSQTMDVVDSLYHYLANDQLIAQLSGGENRVAAYDLVGPGVLLHKWASLRNILLHTGNFKTPDIVRKGAEEFSWPEQWAEARELYLNFEAV